MAGQVGPSASTPAPGRGKCPATGARGAPRVFRAQAEAPRQRHDTVDPASVTMVGATCGAFAHAAEAAGFNVPLSTLIHRMIALARITSTHTIITTVTTEFR
jgi:hypothetical protein